MSHSNSSSNAIWLNELERACGEQERAEAMAEWQDRVPTVTAPVADGLHYAHMVEYPLGWRFRRWCANAVFRLGGAIAP